MPKRRYLVTSGLPYSNGRLHVGHIAGAYLPADTYVRYLRARGDEVLLRLRQRRQRRRLPDLRPQGGHAGRGTDRPLQRPAGRRLRRAGHPVRHLRRHPPARLRRTARAAQPGVLPHDPRQGLLRQEDHGTALRRRGRPVPARPLRQGHLLPQAPDGSACGYSEAYGDQCESCGNAIDPMQLIDPVSTITGTRPEPRETTHWYLQLQPFENPLRKWLETQAGAGRR